MEETARLRPGRMAMLEREKPVINTAKNTVAAILLAALALSACVALLSDGTGAGAQVAHQSLFNSQMITPGENSDSFLHMHIPVSLV